MPCSPTAGRGTAASELLAVAGPLLRTPASYAVYAHYRDLVKEHLDPDERRRIIDRADDLSASEVLDEELERLADLQEAGAAVTG